MRLLAHLLLISSFYRLSIRAWEPKQCYYAADQKLPFDSTMDSYYPCGETEDGQTQSCCQAGHKCLGFNACYDTQFGITYSAGCTDSKYEDSACPSKCGYTDVYWIGHNHCDTKPVWDCCRNNYGNSENQHLFPSKAKVCKCDEQDTLVAIKGPNPLPDIAMLEFNPEITISYFPGRGPSGTLTESFTPLPRPSTSTRPGPPSSPTNSPSASSSNSSNSTSPTSAPKTSESSVSKNTAIGLGVGLSLGSTFLIAAIVILILNRRRKHKINTPPPVEDQIRPKSAGSDEGGPHGLGPHGLGLGMAMSPDDIRSPAWSGHKSELAADDQTTITSPTLPGSTIRDRESLVEAPGSMPGSPDILPVGGSRTSGTTGTTVLADTAAGRQYVPYHPYHPSRLGDVHEMPG